MATEFSVFDIIGPRMTGPSSSHTAGACRIGNMARRIAGQPVRHAHFTLYGSFAQTGRGHGTDKALVAGVLNMPQDDARIPEALILAEEAGMQVDFTLCNEESPHGPNTVCIRLTGINGEETEVLGCSIGGGNILIVEINALEVEISGEYPTLIIQYRDVPGVVSVVTHVLAQHHINIAFMRVFRHGRGEDAYMTIETDQEISTKVRDLLVGLSDEITTAFTV
ncbi:L-serine ammonia-lyase, iron-sulfur-dependent subunit beta [Christensenellaceae bacterium OttesenSCG-928-L17]|nr:L-serine ammonia-lyase, iron-sulfur-dependent subunit beta [Christensenellaceae bacterium OttesenSCG-928-L17]